MFTVYLTNFGYPLTPSFNTLEEAIAAARKACFEAGIIRLDDNGKTLVATFSPISGIRFI